MSIWHPMPSGKLATKVITSLKNTMKIYLDNKFTTVPLQIRISPCSCRNHFTLFMVPFMAAIAHHLYIPWVQSCSGNKCEWLAFSLSDADMKVLSQLYDTKNFSSAIWLWHSAVAKAMAKIPQSRPFGCLWTFAHSSVIDSSSVCRSAATCTFVETGKALYMLLYTQTCDVESQLCSLPPSGIQRAASIWTKSSFVRTQSLAKKRILQMLTSLYFNRRWDAWITLSFSHFPLSNAFLSTSVWAKSPILFQWSSLLHVHQYDCRGHLHCKHLHRRQNQDIHQHSCRLACLHLTQTTSSGDDNY